MLARLLFVVIALALAAWLWVVGTPGRPVYPTPNYSEGRLLSDQEREVAYLNWRGLGIKEIAQVMAISTNTVKRYVHRIYCKTGLRSRIELAVYYDRHWGRAVDGVDGLVLYG